ncbi:GAF domain-containing protein [Mesorhizobium sp. CN2-181]|uniref:GAF domain-containing protein n=1 Tax=Mesorhizobium yinganensis TaxID=3157707 RepID=UPI0032B72BF8
MLDPADRQALVGHAADRDRPRDGQVEMSQPGHDPSAAGSAITLVCEAGARICAADGPETVVNRAASVVFAGLGDRHAHELPDALRPGQTQFFVAGCFFVTPGRQHQMLIGNIGFPPEQRRLLIPIDGGNPGQVIASGMPLLLADTEAAPDFRQYLKTSRMGSAIYAPLIWQGDTIGLFIMAAQARWTMRQADLEILRAIAPTITAAWMAHGGPEWLRSEYMEAIRNK